MSLFKAMDAFEYDAKKGRFRAYLRSSVVRALGRKATKRTPRATSLDSRVFDALAVERCEDDAIWQREWQLNRLRIALRIIAGEFEQVTMLAFRLHVLANRPVSEVANQLDMSTASVYQAKSRILKRLREQVEALGSLEEPWETTA